MLSQHFFWQFVSICDQRKELQFLRKKSRSCYDYWKEVKCLMRILCVKVIWEAEALIFQNSSGKFMNVVKSVIMCLWRITNICWPTPNLLCQLSLRDSLFWEWADWLSQWKSRMPHQQTIIKQKLTESVKSRVYLISKQLLNKS